jgi:broad specificity phosphatase PhoE
MSLDQPQLVILRHGESFGNLEGKYLTLDAFNFLTPTGVEQARGVILPDLIFKRRYVSELTRSKHTMYQTMLINEVYIPETFQEATARAARFAIEARRVLRDEGNILAVAHDQIIRALFYALNLLPTPLEVTVPHCHPYAIGLSEFDKAIGSN